MRTALPALACLALAALPAAALAQADWRAQANRRIERVRKADVTVSVVDGTGEPVPGASVQVEMLRHAFWFGTAVNLGKTSPEDAAKYREVLLSHFNSVVHENAMKWYHTQPQGGPPDFSDADRMLAWSEAHGLRTRGHCIFWGKYKYVPAWQKAVEDDARLHELVLARARRITRRYRGRVNEWDLNNEMLDPDFYADRLGPGIIREMAAAALEGNPDAVLYVNDYAILAGWKDRPRRYAEQVQALLDVGVPIGGIGLQGHFVNDRPDPVKVKAALDLMARFGLPIKITEYDCTDDTDGTALETVYRLAFAEPQVNGILMWGFWAGRHWKPEAALYARDWTPRPAATMYKKLVLDEWWTRSGGTTDALGTWPFRGFAGTYRVTVTPPGGGAPVVGTEELGLGENRWRVTVVGE